MNRLAAAALTLSMFSPVGAAEPDLDISRAGTRPVNSAPLNRPDQLRSHMALARTNSLTNDEIVETLTRSAFYTGWPNAMFSPKP